MFEVGDAVSVPGCGLGHVEAVETVDGGGGPMYRLFVEEAAVRLWVPVAKATARGLRAPLSNDALERVIDIVKQTEPQKNRETWNRRQRRYQEHVLDNRPEGLAEVLGELAVTKRRKALSFGERRTYEQVRNQLCAEIEAWDQGAKKGLERLEATVAEAAEPVE